MRSESVRQQSPESGGGGGIHPAAAPAVQVPVPVSKPPNAVTAPVGEAKPQIRAFEQKIGTTAVGGGWVRKPSVTGTGAVHVKSFHCKLTGDSLEFLDKQINEWLDAHPDCEVKNVTTSVGDWTGKLREPNLIVQVWV
jgi:hypothetical protein